MFTTDPYDNDPDAGELKVSDLVLGKYTVEETIPPAGYHIQDPLEPVRSTSPT